MIKINYTNTFILYTIKYIIMRNKKEPIICIYTKHL